MNSDSFEGLEFTEEHFQRIQEKLFDEMSASFSHAATAIQRLFQEYHYPDLVRALGAIELWLPNLPSYAKMAMATHISLTCRNCVGRKPIVKFREFKDFYERLAPLFPKFFMLEDYTPVQDWGEIYFHSNHELFKMFYGSNLEASYYFLENFRLLANGYKESHSDSAINDPLAELRALLELQNQWIRSLPNNRKEKRYSPGHLELPTQEFWELFIKAYATQQIRFTSNRDVWSSLCITAFPDSLLTYTELSDLVKTSSIVDGIWSDWNGQAQIHHPRMINETFVSMWNDRLMDYIAGNPIPIARVIGEQTQRMFREKVFLFPCSVDESFEPDAEPISFAFISGKTLVAVGVYSGDVDQIEEHAIQLKIKSGSFLRIYDGMYALGILSENGCARIHTSEYTSVETILIVPCVSTNLCSPGDVLVVSSVEWLFLMEELTSANEFMDFVNFIRANAHKIQPGFMFIDYFGAFRESHGEIITGANHYDLFSLDPHWGDRYCYAQLKTFWEMFPKVELSDIPRTYRVNTVFERGAGRSLVHKHETDVILTIKVAKCVLTIESYFQELDAEEIKVVGTFSQIILFQFNDLKNEISEHPYFTSTNRLRIRVLPFGFVQRTPELEQLLYAPHTKSTYKYGVMNRTDGESELIMLIQMDEFMKALTTATDDSLEIEVVISILNAFSSREHPEGHRVIRKIQTFQGKSPPNFIRQDYVSDVSFPRHLRPIESTDSAKKWAANCVAHAVKIFGLTPRNYHESGPLNSIRDELVKRINQMLSEYECKDLLSFLIGQIDAWHNLRHYNLEKAELAQSHYTEYDPLDAHRESDQEFLSQNPAIRYLIEKVYTNQCSGTRLITDSEYLKLVELSKWILNIYSISDRLYYQYIPAPFRVDKDYLLHTTQSEGESALRQVQENIVKQYHGIGFDASEIDFTFEIVQKNFDEINTAFSSDLGFRFKALMFVLECLHRWGHRHNHVDSEEQSFYRITKADFFRGMREFEVNEIFEEQEINIALDFLCLDAAQICKLDGKSELELDIPVWELNKRTHRYLIRPILKIDDHICWGPWSAYFAAKGWSDYVFNGIFPYASERLPAIHEILTKVKKSYESKLSQKVAEAFKPKSKFIRVEFDLRKSLSKHRYPDIGDFDVFSYFPEKNALILVECKFNKPKKCLKDDKRLFDDVFVGKDSKPSQAVKIQARRSFVENNWEQIFDDLKWVRPPEAPKIEALYVTLELFWWFYIPEATQLGTCLSLSQLSHWVEEILGQTQMKCAPQ